MLVFWQTYIHSSTALCTPAKAHKSLLSKSNFQPKLLGILEVKAHKSLLSKSNFQSKLLGTLEFKANKSLPKISTVVPDKLHTFQLHRKHHCEHKPKTSIAPWTACSSVQIQVIKQALTISCGSRWVHYLGQCFTEQIVNLRLPYTVKIKDISVSVHDSILDADHARVHILYD